MDEETLKQYYAVYTDAWRFFKKYSNPEDTEEFRVKVTKEALELEKKYSTEQCGKLASDILAKTIIEIYRLIKER